MSNTEIKEKVATMWVTYVPNIHNKREDALIVKERVLDLETMEERPRVRIVRNYQRPYFVTKPDYRTHNDKREYEYLDKCDVYYSTEAELSRKLAHTLGKTGNFFKLKELCRSQYVYGTDVKPQVLYKNERDTAEALVNGSWRPEMIVAVLDYETDMNNGTEEIISGAVTCGNKRLIVATAGWLGIELTGDKEKDKTILSNATRETRAKLQELSDAHMKKGTSKTIKSEGGDELEGSVEISFQVVRTPYGVAKACMAAAHEIKPDLLAIWNMGFDVDKMLEACEQAGQHPASLFCDPKVPPDLQYFHYKKDQLKKKKADGSSSVKGVADLWHVITAAASFYMIDAMSSYRMLRAIEGLRQSYSLQSILVDEEIGSKLYFEGLTDAPDGTIYWHRVMQKDHKLPYMLYNMGDCTEVEALDRQTKDLSLKIGAYANGTDLPNINSNPKRLCNSLYFYLRERGMVPGSTSDQMKHEWDSLVLDREDWVVTLGNELNVGTGRKVFDGEWGEFISRVAHLVADIDITSGYPTTQYVMNACKSALLTECCEIEGYDEFTMRRIGVNISNIRGNAVNISQTLLQYPTFEWWEEEIKKDGGIYRPKKEMEYS